MNRPHGPGRGIVRGEESHAAEVQYRERLAKLNPEKGRTAGLVEARPMAEAKQRRKCRPLPKVDGGAE